MVLLYIDREYGLAFITAGPCLCSLEEPLQGPRVIFWLPLNGYIDSLRTLCVNDIPMFQSRAGEFFPCSPASLTGVVGHRAMCI